MNSEDVKKWLNEIGKSREWLASECNVSKRTIDGWFSKGMPSIAIALITKLMRDYSYDLIDNIKLTFDEWSEISKAMKKYGYDNFSDFAVDAVKLKIKQEESLKFEMVAEDQKQLLVDPEKVEEPLTNFEKKNQEKSK